MIDLHIHSTFSDGSLTPAELAEEAVRAGLSAVALTDHDSLGGVEPFLAACIEARVKGLSGVEISVEHSPGTMHMLAYLMDPRHAELARALIGLREGREERNRRILEALNRLGIALTWEEVTRFAAEDVVGRPHFAQALVARGVVESPREAFDRYLAKGRPAYVDRYRLTARTSIELIRRAGGVATLAHPSTLERSRRDLRRLVTQLKDWGLEGIEAYYSEHSPAQQEEYLGLAQDFDLVPTGGSDFHGALNPDIRLGYGFGNLRVPDEIVDRLHARLRAR
jgi:predicted metal-dependent phosphoesterase TrpH